MLYGAYGTTGRLILDEALRRGHRPILAGRDAAKLQQLQRVTALDTEHVPLERAPELRAALSGMRCVVLAAGPYELTGPLMRAACLGARCSYLDINAAVDDFRQALACDEAARTAGVAVIPGVGYGVVFGECLAAQTSRRVPGATSLRLSLATETEERSRAATLSVAQALTRGGLEVHDGELRHRPIAFTTWRAPDSQRPATTFAAMPMAELVAAHRSTGVPNIVAGIPMSPVAAAFLRATGPWIGKVLARTAARRSGQTGSPPSHSAIAAMRSRIWAEARNDDGASAAAMLETGEGYRAAAAATVRAVESLLQTPRVGALTPVQAFGADFDSIERGKTFNALLRETLVAMVRTYGVFGTVRALRNMNIVQRKVLRDVTTMDLLAHPPQLAVPVHFVFGAHDALTAAFLSSELPAAIGAPGTTAVRVPQAGHLVHFDRPDVVRSIVENA